MQITFINSLFGITKIVGDENGLCIISILSEVELSTKIPTELQEAVKQLQEYFEGKRSDFNFKLNPKETDFQQKVWQELVNILFGKTISYLDLAKKLADPKVIRAATSANGNNPLWIVVPCHRVIGTDGSLTGYAGGLWRKQWLLEHENLTNQQSLF
jgi:methylated-DNA-[protein]-cysteine S-methyltransferase